MRIILAGKLENAALREATIATDPERLTPSNSYYASILRPTSQEHIDRSATFMALADQTDLPSIDWSARAQGFDGEDFEQSLGLHHLDDAADRDSNSETEISAFAAILLHYRAFPQRLVRSISKVHWETERKNQSRTSRHGVLSVNMFAHHHLCRLLQQVDAAGDHDIPLVVTEEEVEILAKVEAFILNANFPPPILLPSMRKIDATDIDRFAGGVLKFSPPDFLAVAAVRRDPLFRKYAAQVREILGQDGFTPEGESRLIDALREAYLDSEVARKTGRVFEIEGWALKPLQFVPGLGNVVAFADFVVTMGQEWAKREHKSRQWHLIGARMKEVSIEDYLRRAGNK